MLVGRSADGFAVTAFFFLFRNLGFFRRDPCHCVGGSRIEPSPKEALRRLHSPAPTSADLVIQRGGLFDQHLSRRVLRTATFSDTVRHMRSPSHGGPIASSPERSPESQQPLSLSYIKRHNGGGSRISQRKHGSSRACVWRAGETAFVEDGCCSISI